MAYCIVSDVQSMFKNITFAATDAITDTEVSNWIDEESAILDSLLRARYNIPLTGTNSLEVLKKVCAFIVAGRVDVILNQSTGINAEKIQYSETLWDQGKMLWKGIKDNTIVLDDIDLKTPIADTYVSRQGNTEVPCYDDVIKPFFHKQEVQW